MSSTSSFWDEEAPNEGEVAGREAVLEVLAEVKGEAAAQTAHALESLTPEEHQIAGLAAEGLPVSSIARTLDIEPDAVEQQLQEVFERLGISSREELERLFEIRLAPS